MKQVIPLEWFGVGIEGELNRREILSHINRFITLRRFETLSLHETCQKLKVKFSEITNQTLADSLRLLTYHGSARQTRLKKRCFPRQTCERE